MLALAGEGSPAFAPGAFEVATAQAYPGSGYDLVAMFDRLHGMGDPVGASTHVHRSRASRSQPVSWCRGAQRLARLGGFNHLRCATQTPFKLMFEARA